MKKTIKWSPEEDNAIIAAAINAHIRLGTDHKEWRLTPSLTVQASIAALPKERTSLYVDIKEYKRLRKLFQQRIAQHDPSAVYSEHIKFVANFGATPYEVIEGLQRCIDALVDDDDEGDDDDDDDDLTEILVVARQDLDLGDLKKYEGTCRITCISEFNKKPVVKMAAAYARNRHVFVVGKRTVPQIVIGALKRTAENYCSVPDVVTLHEALEKIEGPRW